MRPVIFDNLSVQGFEDLNAYLQNLMQHDMLHGIEKQCIPVGCYAAYDMS